MALGPQAFDPQEALTVWAATCPKLSLAQYIQSCTGQWRAKNIVGAWDKADHPITAKDLVSILCAIGAMEPLGATLPRACDIVTQFDTTTEVPPAAIDASGKITPSSAVLIKICAPQHRSLVVHELLALPANLTAEMSGEIFSKALQVPGFSEFFCPPGEPGPGKSPDIGVFYNVRRVILCPGAGFDVSARNHDPYSPALFHVKAVTWSTC